MGKETYKTARAMRGAHKDWNRIQSKKAWEESEVELRTDYETASLIDIIENTVDIAMNLVANRGMREGLEEQWGHYIEFYNCCAHPEFYENAGRDAKELLLRLHKDAKIRGVLEAYGWEQYAAAVSETVRRKKDVILKFWDEHVEMKCIQSLHYTK